MKLYVFYKQEKKKIHKFSCFNLSSSRLKEVITSKIIKADVYTYKHIEEPNLSDLKSVCRYRVHYSNSLEDKDTKYTSNFSGRNQALEFYNSMCGQGFKAKFFVLENIESLDINDFKI